MRCATCGTENEPNSRFCGGCGAKQPGLTAPTAKIHDDAPYPNAGQPQSAPSSAPAAYGHGPASIPPPAMPTPVPGSMQAPPAAHGSIPPANNPVSRPPDSVQRNPSRAPNVSAPNVSRAPVSARSLNASDVSGSIALPARRPIGLIAIVLLLDLGLAAAGAVMLGKGLSKDEKAAPKPEEKPALKTETERRPTDLQATAPSVPSATAIAAAAAPPSADSAPAANVPAKVAASPTDKAAADKGTASRRGKDKDRATASGTPQATKASGKTATAATGPVTSPQDPYADTAQPQAAAPAPKLTTEQEIEKLHAKSKSAFDRCVGAAAPVHGQIQIAFQVLADGHVSNAAAVEDSTGKAELGPCLASTISGWALSPHSGSALNFVRSFNYP